MKNISSALKQQRKSSGDDRISTTQLEDGSYLMLLADGCAGIGLGYMAADLFIKTCTEKLLSFPTNNLEIIDIIYDVDAEISTNNIAADTTGIIVIVKDDQLISTSVGDSEAWLITPHETISLTDSQSIKPRIGDGCFVKKVEAHRIPPQSYIVMTSDGIFDSFSSKQLFDLVKQNKTASEIINIILKDNEQFDDLSLIIAKF